MKFGQENGNKQYLTHWCCHPEGFKVFFRLPQLDFRSIKISRFYCYKPPPNDGQTDFKN